LEKTIVKLYTKEEVIEILRLDEKNVKNPIDSLRYLIRTRQLRAIKICGELRFTEDAINEYIGYCASLEDK